MIVFDFLIINSTNLFITSVLLLVFYLNDRHLYLLLTFDLILHQMPMITIIIILFYHCKQLVFKYLPNYFIWHYLLIIIFYFGFGLIIYGIYHEVNFYIIKYLFANLWLNLIIFYLGMKYLQGTYIKIGA